MRLTSSSMSFSRRRWASDGQGDLMGRGPQLVQKQPLVRLAGELIQVFTAQTIDKILIQELGRRRFARSRRNGPGEGIRPHGRRFSGHRASSRPGDFSA